MTFANQKKTFLAKTDKSKKGGIDPKVVSLMAAINALDDYYTTSSCSGRVYFWQGEGKKNEKKWLTVSHELVAEDFFEMDSFEINSFNLSGDEELNSFNLSGDEKLNSFNPDGDEGLIWLRLEPFIMHVCCRNAESAKRLLLTARKLFKKSCILSLSSKIVVEIRGSELMEIPFYLGGKMLFCGELSWLKELVNDKLKRIWTGIEKLEKEMKIPTANK